MHSAAAPEPVLRSQPTGGRSGGVPQRWLVHHYCQGAGLADSLRLLSPDVTVEVIDQYTDPEVRREALERIDGFERVVIEPSIARQFAAAGQVRLIVVPTVAFRGYHPDFFLLRDGDGRQFAGPTGSAHSMIAYCAFLAGRTQREAVALYREEVYAACGYLGQWSACREELLSSFRQYGLDLAREFVRWSRRGPFMHSIIHPRIDCLRDIARKLLEREGLRVWSGDFLPPDGLAYREVLAVYPEIARRVGIAGSYLFKSGGARQQVFDLEVYVERSYAHLRKGSGVHVVPAYVPLVERVKTAIESFA